MILRQNFVSIIGMEDEILTRKKTPDWEKIELDYRAGVKSMREIAAEHGITHAAINKRAKREQWDRDLSARIQAKADALVSKAEVSKMVTAEKLETEKATVDANAQAIANVRLSHRKDITRIKDLASSLLDELSGQTIDRELFEQLGELMFNPDDKGIDKLNELYRKVISTPSRIDSMKKLTEAFKNLVSMEREAWGIDRVIGETGNPLLDLIAIVAERQQPLVK